MSLSDAKRAEYQELALHGLPVLRKTVMAGGEAIRALLSELDERNELNDELAHISMSHAKRATAAEEATNTAESALAAVCEELRVAREDAERYRDWRAIVVGACLRDTLEALNAALCEISMPATDAEFDERMDIAIATTKERT